MRLFPSGLAAVTATVALAALPSVLLAQDRSVRSPQSSPAVATPTVEVRSTAETGSHPSLGNSNTESSSGSTARSGGSGSRSSYGGGRSYAPLGYSRNGAWRPPRGGTPPPRVSLPAPRVQPRSLHLTNPAATRGVERGPGGRARSPGAVWTIRPLPSGAEPMLPTPPSALPVSGSSRGRAPVEIPGRVQLPGRIELPGVIGMPEDLLHEGVAPGEPRAGMRQPDGDARLLPPPDEPGIGRPLVPKPAPEKPPPDEKSPPPDESAPPQTVPVQWTTRWTGYGFGWYNYGWPSWLSYRSCRIRMMMMPEEELYFERLSGMDPFGCGAWQPYFVNYYGDYYPGGSYIFSPWPNRFSNLLPCAVVTAETYSGNRYSIAVMLPEFQAYGPRGLRRAIFQILDADGEVTLLGSGDKQMQLYAGFVKTLNTRWCGPGEW